MQELELIGRDKELDALGKRITEFLGVARKRQALWLHVFGEEGVQKHFRLAPVPSLFIDGELFFDAIPPKFELEAAIEEVLLEKGLREKC